MPFIEAVRRVSELADRERKDASYHRSRGANLWAAGHAEAAQALEIVCRAALRAEGATDDVT